MDRKVFYDRVRLSPFGGRLAPHQVEGMEAMLDAFALAGWRLEFAAYGLATAFHETAGRMQPVIETRQADEAANPSVDEAIGRLESSWARGKMPWVTRAYWRKDADGRSWLGRGHVQTTHRANYAWAQELTGVPFLTKPELMLELRHSLPVMILGMERGLYTGKKLADYCDTLAPDYVEARRIINGTESAAKVAGHARDFQRALKAAGYAPDWRKGDAPVPAPPKPAVAAPPAKLPPPPDIPAPEPAPAAAPAPGFLARFLAALLRPRKDAA